MKPQLWLPTVVFLVVAIPLVLLLNALQLGGEYRVWIALIVGAVATALVQQRLKKRGEQE